MRMMKSSKTSKTLTKKAVEAAFGDNDRRGSELLLRSRRLDMTGKWELRKHEGKKQRERDDCSPARYCD